jgi:hemerythrin-like domain-containing protein
VLRRQTEEHMDREEEEVLPVLRRELDQERSLALRQEMVAFMVETADAGLDAPIESALSNMEPRLEQ